MPGPRLPASRATAGCSGASAYPPLYYAASALAMLPLRTAPLFARLLAMRLVSVLLGAVAALLVFAAARRFFGSVREALLVALVFALQPMLAFLFSIGNNDAALFAALSWALWSITLLFDTPRPSRALASLGLAALVGALCKPTLVVLLPSLFALAVAALGPRRRASWLSAALALSPAAATGVGWTLAASRAGLTLPADPSAPYPLAGFVFKALAPRHLWFTWHELYWMAWGWLDTFLPKLDYLALLGVLLAAALVAAIHRARLAPRARGLLAAGAVATGLALFCLSLVELLWARRYGVLMLQGRYLLPLFPLHAAMLVTALGSPGAPRRPLADPAWHFVVLLALLDVASVARALGRYHG